MATLQQIRNAVDARLADFFPKIRTRQEVYAANHGGNYWQGLAFSSVPDDGALATPDFSAAPADQFDYTPPVTSPGGAIVTPEVRTARSWAWMGASADLPAQVEAQLRIDVYGRDGAHGYFVTASVSKDGTTYARTAQVEDGLLLTTGAWRAVP